MRSMRRDTHLARITGARLHPESTLTTPFERWPKPRGPIQLVVLSDHGQIETVPFYAEDGVQVGELVAHWMRGFRVEEMKGKAFGPDAEQAKGWIRLTYTGGLAHILRGRRQAPSCVRGRRRQSSRPGPQSRSTGADCLGDGRGRSEDIFIAAA